MRYPWFDSACVHFSQVYQQGKFPQTLLLTGKYDTGLSTLANDLAGMLLCQTESTAATPLACGHCQGCRMLREQQSHPDFQIIEPEKNLITVERMRELPSWLANTRYFNGNRVVIIERIECMNINAANAFLKTLEEPRDRTYFILTTGDISRLLPTIISRAQQFHTHVDYAQVSTWLQQTHGTLPDEFHLKSLWAMSNERPLKMQELLAQEDEKMAERQLLIELLQRKYSPLDLAEKYASAQVDVDDLQLFLYWLSTILFDIIKVQNQMSLTYLTYPDYQSHYRQLASKHDQVWCHAAYQKAQKTIRLLSRSANINKQLLLESLFIQLAK